jgi:hypothetical protein
MNAVTGRFVMRHGRWFAAWKTANLTASFCKSPLDRAKSGEEFQCLAAKFPVRPNSEIKSAQQGNDLPGSANAPGLNRVSGNWAGSPTRAISTGCTQWYDYGAWRRVVKMIMDGTIVKGCGAATRTVAAQLPIFEQQYDELRGAHPATINVDVHRHIDLKIDFRTLPFLCGHEWWPFEFIRVLFEYPSGTKTKAWIYQPYGYHWGVKKDKSTIEVLISKCLAGVTHGTPCRIHVLNSEWGASTTTSAHYLREGR